MNPNFKRTMLAACLGSAIGLAGAAFAAGSLPNQLDLLAQSSATTGTDTPKSGSSGTSGSGSTMGTPGSTTGTTGSTTGTTGSSSTTGTSGSSTMGGGTTGSSTTGMSTPGSSATGTSGTASPNAQANAVFDQLDTNKDGMLSREEFARATIRTQ